MKQYFIDVIKNHYVDFSGTATRTQFWMFTLWCFIVFFVLGVIAGICGAISASLAKVFGIIIPLVYLGLLLPSIAIQVRRVRDLGISGWFTLLGLIGGIILLIFDVLPTNCFAKK